MNWIELKVNFYCKDKALATELIANLFYDSGLQGVVIETPEAETLEEWGENAVRLPEKDSVIGYIPSDPKSEMRIRELEASLRELDEDNHIHNELIRRVIDEEDWAHSWKEYFNPVTISETLVIKPTWKNYTPTSNHELIIEIDPGMAFGTGTHPTTILCLQMIESYLKRGDSVLDIGTGSGILMIAAAKLGASFVCGVDADPLATEIARNNLIMNHVEPSSYGVITGNLAHGITGRFDLIVANILTEVVVSLLDQIPRLLNKSGTFLCSGITEEKKSEVLAKAENLKLRIAELRSMKGWVAIAIQ